VRPGLDKSARALLVPAVLALAAFAFYLTLGLPVGIRGQWEWRYYNIPVPNNLLPAFLAVLALSLLTWFLVRLPWKEVPRPRRALWLTFLVLAVFGLQAALLSFAGGPWMDAGGIIISPVATTYFSTSYDIRDVRGWTAAYQDRMPALGHHVRTHPPGLVLLFYGLRQLAAHVVPAHGTQFDAIAEVYRCFGLGPTPGDAAAAIFSAFLIALLGAVGILGVYALSIRLMSDQAALYATVLAGALPSLLLFGASPDLLIFTLTATTLALSYVAWREGRPLPAFFAGLVFAVASFLSFGVIALAVWLALLVVVGTLRRPDRPATVRVFLPLLLSGLAGVALVYLVLHLALGYHPLAVAREGLFAHRAATANELARAYWTWVLVDPIDFLLFAGLPLTVAAAWALPAISRQPDLRCLRTFLIASVLIFVILDLSGTVRGEVGRIWLFLMWPLAMAAAPALEARTPASAVAALVVLQGLQVILMKACLFQYMVL